MLSNTDLQRLLESDGDIEEVKAEPKNAEPEQPEPRCKPEATSEVVLCDGGVRNTVVQRAAAAGARIGDGCIIGYRTAEGQPLKEAEIGSPSLPWALEVTARRVKVGDVVDVVGIGEHALADDEDSVHDTKCPERRWRFEIATVRGSQRDKFRMSVDERIDMATQLRERGNAMLKRGRLQRAADYYERGSSLMDVIEAEDMGGMGGMGGGGGMGGMGAMGGMNGMGAGMGGGKKDEKAVANNKRIRECQKPILLNWALVLMKRSQWQEAERKCAEVILDIDSSCVKALFRRGQCQVQLGNLDDAKKDLLQARDLDDSIAGDVEKELAKLKRQQKILDRQDRGWAQKALQKGLADTRSANSAINGSNGYPKPEGADKEDDIECSVKESSKTRLMPSMPSGGAAPGASLIDVLSAQEAAAKKDDIDEDTYCRQREAIYNQFMTGQRPNAD